MNLNEEELTALLIALRSFMEENWLSTDLRRHYTEEFSKKIDPIIQRIIKNEKTNNEEIAKV
jgi:hypothetical protein